MLRSCICTGESSRPRAAAAVREDVRRSRDHFLPSARAAHRFSGCGWEEWRVLTALLLRLHGRFDRPQHAYLPLRSLLHQPLVRLLFLGVFHRSVHLHAQNPRAAGSLSCPCLDRQVSPLQTADSRHSDLHLHTHAAASLITRLIPLSWNSQLHPLSHANLAPRRRSCS